MQRMHEESWNSQKHNITSDDNRSYESKLIKIKTSWSQVTVEINRGTGNNGKPQRITHESWF